MKKVKSIISHIKRHLKYYMYEIKCRRGGDERDDFEKLVDKCRILKLNKTIFNAF